MVPLASHKISRASWYSGSSLLFLLFVYRILTFCDWPSQTIRLSIHHFMRVLQPQSQRIGLGSSLFARRYWGNRVFFLFLRVLRCFSSPGLPGIQCRTCQKQVGCPIRKSVLERVFAPGHGLSQLVTSFIASESQGILHVPFSPFCIF